MNEYSKLLKRLQWKYIAVEVKKRDNYKCVKCGKSRSLHVHHTVYIYGRLPWEYDMKYLQTLCNVCHKIEHESKSSFSTRDKNIIKDSKPKKIGVKNKNKPRVINISKELTDKRKRLEIEGKIHCSKPFEIKLNNNRK